MFWRINNHGTRILLKYRRCTEEIGPLCRYGVVCCSTVNIYTGAPTDATNSVSLPVSTGTAHAWCMKVKLLDVHGRGWSCLFYPSTVEHRLGGPIFEGNSRLRGHLLGTASFIEKEVFHGTATVLLIEVSLYSICIWLLETLRVNKLVRFISLQIFHTIQNSTIMWAASGNGICLSSKSHE